MVKLSDKNGSENGTSWIESEVAGYDFQDARLNSRFKTFVKSLWGGLGKTIPLACQDWSNTKAAYRFLSNERVNEADILSGHFQSIQKRFNATTERVLILHDTTEFSYQRSKPEDIGIIHKIKGPKKKYTGPNWHTVCGILMHASLAITTEGVPLGLSAVKFWTRDMFKGSAALSRKVNPTRVPIEKKESFRWIENVRSSTDLLTKPKQCYFMGGLPNE